MKTRTFLLAAAFTALLFNSCIDNNNKDDNSSQGNQHESDAADEAPTYNKTRDDIEKNSGDTTGTEKRVPKDPVEIKSKGNASSV